MSEFSAVFLTKIEELKTINVVKIAAISQKSYRRQCLIYGLREQIYCLWCRWLDRHYFQELEQCVPVL